MASDSLDYTMYMAIARFLTTRVEPHVKGSAGLVRPQKRAQEPSYYPQDMQLPEEEQRLLWNTFYAKSKE